MLVTEFKSVELDIAMYLKRYMNRKRSLEQKMTAEITFSIHTFFSLLPNLFFIILDKNDPLFAR